MSCTGLPLTTPNISCLDYLLTWDLSGATPTVTITNNSTVSNAANLRWWFYVVSPNGAAVYGVNLATVSPLPTPDVTGVPWTTKIINLPTPFGNPPCGQIEFSPTNPYNVYVYVTDISFSTTSFFTLNKNTLLPRPNGNCSNSCGNFGDAAVSMQTNCLNQSINVYDGTNLIYNNILTPASTSNVWTLVYPQNSAGGIPNVVVHNQANVNFPTSINSDSYVLYFQEYAIYNYGNGITVIIQYKLFSKGSNISPLLGQQFAINCNTNLCLLQCQMQRFYKASKGNCGTLENTELINKMTQMSFLFNQIITGIFQPLCGIDIPKLMAEITAIGNFDPNCDCSCGGSNFGFSNPTGGGSAVGCCPVYTSVIDHNTGVTPLNCPNGYFPANTYDPTGTTIIGNATSIGDEIAIINANVAWQQYGTAFDAGNCKVGFFPATGVTVIPKIQVDPNGGGSGGGATVIVDIIDPCGYPPNTCPNGYFPAQVYNPTGAIIIGIASDINSLVGIINGYGGWQVIGTAFVVDNCHVGFYPKPGVTSFPEVVVTYGADTGCGGTTTDCVNGQQTYPVTIMDVCVTGAPPITASSFPCNVYVNFGLGAGLEFIGNATSQINMISELNAAADKPAGVTFSEGSTVSQVIVNNTNCTLYSGVISITADAGSDNFLLFGGNHTNLLGVPSGGENKEFAFSVKSLSIQGKIASNIFLWHNIVLGTVLLSTDPNGQIDVWDISNPLMPLFIQSITLTNSHSNFTGTPESITIASAVSSPGGAVPTIYSLYFPTDTYSLMTPDNFYVSEALTGTIWRLTGYHSGVSPTQTIFQDDRLIGKCPRVLIPYMGTQTLFFTQDGDLEQATGQSSGVVEGDVVLLDTSTFSSGGLSTLNIIKNDIEFVWAASYDGVGNIYFTGNRFSIGKLNLSTSAITVFSNVGGAGRLMSYRCNSVYFNGFLYLTPQHSPSLGGGVGMFVMVSSLGGLPAIGFFQQPPGAPIDGLFNFMPLGNCLGIMTSAAVQGDSASSVLIYKTDGTYLSSIPLFSNEEFYNVIPIANIAATTPNNYLPAP